MSAGAINHNSMAANVANNLNSHYARLAVSTRRLSSGLRINSAADDAAGLAIREFMRSDIAAMSQGVRNANDAISMLQVADGALAVIDEKLIRMKELAEQAATGTYDSTQRLMIDSEYKAMADEIDRIARATNFNGIKLLDGSLSGAHDGCAMRAAGRLKIHFGSANDSAEDYYYVAIGDCTTKGLGLHKTGPGGQVYYEKVEGLVETWHTYKPPAFSPNYTDPVTGNIYYYDGDHYFSDFSDPAASSLDWEKDGEIIARLRTRQKEEISNRRYEVYRDRDTGIDYYKYQFSNRYYRDPHDLSSYLKPHLPGEQAILDRLEYQRRMVDIKTTWLVYESENGGRYYSRDNGVTYVSNTGSPDNIALDSTDPADKDKIAALKPVLEGKTISLPSVPVNYVCYRDPQTKIEYLSSDGGKSFCTRANDPDNSALDPVRDKAVIDRLELKPATMSTVVTYDIWFRLVNGYVENFYTNDGGQTFIKNLSTPNDIVLDASDPAHAADIASIKPSIDYGYGGTVFEVYEDTANGMKKYYSHDGGNTFCEDYNDPQGTYVDKSDPGYAQLIASFVKTTTTEQPRLHYDRYHAQGNRNDYYYSCDGGKTFIKDMSDTGNIVLNSSNPADQAKINSLVLYINQQDHYTIYDMYYDPQDNDKIYYVLQHNKDKFVLDIHDPQNVALDSAIAAEKAVIDRLKPVEDTKLGLVQKEMPDIYYTYEDGQSGKIYYSADGGKSFTSDPRNPYADYAYLDPTDPGDKAIIDRLSPHMSKIYGEAYIRRETGGPGVLTISTQQAAQEALATIKNAIVSKDKIRAHLGALQNRLENTVANLSIQAENLQVSESRISDMDMATEMTSFVRSQILTQSAVAMLGQANSFPHMLAMLINA